MLFEGFCKTFLNFSYLSNPLAEVLKDIKIAWKESWKDDKKTRHIHWGLKVDFKDGRQALNQSHGLMTRIDNEL